MSAQVPEPTGLESPIACLGLPDEITISLAVSPESPATVGALLTLARENRLTEIKGIGPARKRTIETSLKLAGCDLGERLGRQFFLRGRPRTQDTARLLDQGWSPETVTRLMSPAEEEHRPP